MSTPTRQFPLAWPAGWKRTQYPQHSRFDTSPERAIDRHGASDMLDRAFTGFTALPAPIVSGMSRDWQAVLGLQDLLRPTADDVQKAFRRLASKYHTDKPSGNHAAMAELNRARDEALKEITS